MAGDLDIHEQVIVLPAGLPAMGALAAVEQASGGVTHQYGPRVLIAAVPSSANASLQQLAPAATMADESEALPERVRTDLDEAGAMGLAAFQLRNSEAYHEAKSHRPHADEPWDTDTAQQPCLHNGDEPHGAALAAEAGAPPLSARLMGRVAVGIIIVEGPTNALKFSAAERTKVVAEVQNGLSWLGSQSSPSGVSFVYDIRVVTLSVQPGPANQTLAQKETRWRDPAMAQLGFGAGMAGVTAYVQQLRTSRGTDWAYCAFFTKYPLGHFAYASLGGPRLVMDYANDGWGPDNIDRVFAHETGHIFNAPDEYTASGCTCGGQWGAFNVPNTNCQACAPGGGVPCIMKANTWAMCAYTPYHLGFPQGQRYSGVFQAGTGSHGLWVNADWNHFVAKWNQWNNQGLRLEDLEISQPGGQLRYSGVFRQGTGGYGLWALANWNSFVAKWNEWSNQGLRLVDLEVTQVGNELRYSGVFRAGTGGYGLWANADWNSFVAKWQEWSNQGLRLVDLSAIQINGQVRYSGVFRQGSGGHGLWALADWNSFVAKWNQWNAQGLRLVDLEITKVGNDTRYSGVFRAGSGGFGLWVGADWSSFLNKWNEWNGQGLRLVDFDVSLTGIEAAASPVAGAMAAADTNSVEGYGVLSLSTDAMDGQTTGAGFGAVSATGESTEIESSEGSGVGAVSLDGEPAPATETTTHGFGAVALTAGGTRTELIGQGSATLPQSDAGGDEETGAGFGGLVHSG
jgi:hypothetical protein